MKKGCVKIISTVNFHFIFYILYFLLITLSWNCEADYVSLITKNLESFSAVGW